ncbi:MAG: tetraacyldisaccharide 4'-kinase [Nitrospirae bacterium]|nr:tetraacyldisaccharide 4'-kinase [Nitrospirota bacterium]
MNIIEALYYCGFIYKKYVGLKKQKKLPHPVISIGNITTGGTGKTPIVIALVRKAVERGFKPCILSRGYKGSSKLPRHASIGKGAVSDFSDLGDEPVLMAQKTREAEIIVGVDRYKAGLLSKDSNLFILDDGFQHWRLYRDIDIVLIDVLAINVDRLLPIGSLREPQNALHRADIIIKTRSDQGNHDSIDKMLNRLGIKCPIFNAGYKPRALINKFGQRFSIDTFSDKSVFAFSGIGNPKSFILTLKSLGVNIAGSKIFRDHYSYTSGDIVELIKESNLSGAQCLITTEKDLLKLPIVKGIGKQSQIYAVELDFIIDNSFYDMVFSWVEGKR